MPAPIPPEVAAAFEEIQVVSTLDGSSEPSLLHFPAAGTPEVLLVGLHTWSFDRFNQCADMLPYCRDRGWALLLPEFRGTNRADNPRVRQAGGSDLARRDVIDATRHVLATRFGGKPPVLFLLGGSGGGHMSLLVAAREDFTWSAVSSWCPITDMALWHSQNKNYAPHAEAVCGGPPSEKPEEYRARSPLPYAANLRDVRLQLSHGRYDRAVSYRHSWLLAEEIEKQQAGNFYFNIFDGSHELRYDQAFAFFDRTMKKDKEAALLTG